MTGTYTIENLVNGKLYVGQSADIDKRWREHIGSLTGRYHENSKLQRAWNKYGEDMFIHDVLVECSEDQLYSEENYWCNLLNVHDDRYGYNIRPTHPYGKPTISEESRKRLSEAQKLVWKDDIGRRKKQSERMLGKQCGLGHIITPEARIKINEGQAKRKKVRPPKKTSEEIREMTRMRSIGNKYGEGRIKKAEELEKMRVALEKRKDSGWVSPLKGIPRPIEVIEKMIKSKGERSYKDINKGIVRNNIRKSVECCNIDGSLYMKFDCMKDALIHFGRNPDSTSHLKRALLNSNKLVYNKYWRYESTSIESSR